MTVNLDSEGRPARKRIWDLPVRVTHALLIVCVTGAWLTRDARQADLHAAFGYCALALTAFRIFWGFTTRGHARFSSFAYSPGAALQYLRGALAGRPRHYTGHNPAGSFAVFGLLALIAAVTITGVFAIGGMHGDGPLAGVPGFAAADMAREWHEWLAWAVLVLAVLHLAGVVWGSFVHRENLAGAMVTGRKIAHDGATEDSPRRGAVAAALLFAAIAFGAAYVLAIAPRDVQRREAAEEAAKAALKTNVWGKECSGCHLAYAPASLPMRSWDATLEGQADHFGEDLGLSEATSARLREYAAGAAVPSWTLWKVAGSTPATTAPLRISELPFWRHAHRDLPESAFRPPTGAGRHDCEACHADATSGIFHPRMIHNPKARLTP